jgi:hypothetical protein
MKRKVFIKINQTLACFTLAKFCGAMFTIIIVAAVRYSISGDCQIEFADF